MTRFTQHLTYANVMSTFAVFLLLGTGTAYAANTVFSTDIVDGQVKTVDLGASAVNSSKVVDNNLTGTDINESTLAGVNAAKVEGHRIDTVVRIWAAAQDFDRAMPDCFPGMEYVRHEFTAPRTGWVLVNAAFTARTSSGAPIAARLENSGGSFTSWQEEILDPGTRGNIALTFVFYAPQGPNSVTLTVCDNNDETASGAVAMEGQMTLLFSPFQLF